MKRAMLVALAITCLAASAEAQPRSAKPNILVIWGDDVGITNISSYSSGLMGYRTPNIDRLAAEGMRFTDSYGEQSCTAGRSSFITGQSVYRTGLSKVGVPGSPIGLQAEDATIAELLKPLGYATGQFGKNHLGDLNRYLPTVHGFDEFFGNLHHLNAEEEPEMADYPPEKDFAGSLHPAEVTNGKVYKAEVCAGRKLYEVHRIGRTDAPPSLIRRCRL